MLKIIERTINEGHLYINVKSDFDYDSTTNDDHYRNSEHDP